MIIGIDPGFTGAIAYLYQGQLVVYDLPIRLIMNKKQIDEKKFSKFIKQHNPHTVKYAAVEDVWVMPNQGIVSSARFMYSAGILIGVLAAHNIKILKTKPNVWKPALGLDRSKKKSLTLARKVFPNNQSDFRLMKHNGRAEAALIAHFAQKSL